jgi:murein DD-endopeptidase MepM/ murein hydrolase activator NlpD
MNPVKTEDGVFRIRNDKMGKGHFGANRGKHNERLHEGLDIAAPFGTDVVASKTGRVTFASSHGGYGRYIRINHPDSSETRYAHLSKIRVIQGDWVKMGKLIGAVGNSGNAADPAIRPHVHFEIRQNGRPMNPLSLMEIRRNDNEA